VAYRLDENGKYVRTVTCGYCYEQGHNKSSCKAKTQNHKDQIAGYEKQIAEDNFTDDWERNYAKRNLESHKAALKVSAKRGKNRKCSHCHEPGHTKRTCPDRKQKIVNWTAAIKRQHERYTRSMVEQGFGIGTLVEVMYNQQPHLALVTGVRIHELRSHQDLDASETHYYGSPSIVNVTLCRPVEHESWGQTRSVAQIGAQLPLQVHNFMGAAISPSEHRTNTNGFIKAIVGPLDAPVIEQPGDRVIKQLATELTDDGNIPDGRCLYS